MSTHATGSRGFAALRPSMMDRLRNAAATSVLVRTVLYAALGLSVTVGGVAAGALIVAPVVASATDTPTTSRTTSSEASSLQSVKMTAAGTWRKLDRATDRILARLPEPVARYALPAIAVLSITGALLALFLPPLSTAPATAVSSRLASPGRGMAMLTPKSTGSVAARKRRPEAIEALAASGASAPDISWRTGLPHDAVQLLLSISPGHRQLHPPTA